METEKTRICPNGKKVKFKMTKEKGFICSHIWIYRDDEQYLHITPNLKNKDSVFVSKNCKGSGYYPMGEIFVNFENLQIENVWSL